VHQILLRAEVLLGRPHRCVAKEQLDLFEFSAGCAAQLGAGATIMSHAA